MKTIIVTGAAGFIGSALCRYLRKHNHARVVGIDSMTYAASEAALELLLKSDPHFTLHSADIRNAEAMASIIAATQPDGIIHLAAETHVDRSIDAPEAFVQTNILGTFILLEAARAYWQTLPTAQRDAFRFLHVSTDEVYGSLGSSGAFTETTPYAPNSPYAASKASADHLVRAWHKTYGLPTLISNCSNNYGPYQFPEKLLPLSILKAVCGEKLPIYGTGENVRDWLYVADHAAALHTIFTRGRCGEKYNVGGNAERRNLDLIHDLCAILDDMVPQSQPYSRLISFVPDRPGHDERYAMDFTKLKQELGWQPATGLADGLRHTVRWYLDHRDWCDTVRDNYRGERLGQLPATGTR